MTAKDVRGFDTLLHIDSGTLERPVAVEPYHSFTELRIEDGKIKLSPKAKTSVAIAPAEGMLERFVSLADADEHQFLNYARTWGLLELCKQHFAPVNHNINCKPIIPFRTVVLGTTECAAMEHHIMLLTEGEPISAWRCYARFARALLNIAARLHQDEIGRDEDWRTLHFDEAGHLGWDHSEKRKYDNFSGLKFEKSLIAAGVNYWLESGGVQPKVLWTAASRPIITFDCHKASSNLFANLAIQLMMAVCQVASLAICSSCGQSYKPGRRPKHNQRRYCQNCTKARQRDASADYRRRKRAKGQSVKAG